MPARPRKTTGSDGAKRRWTNDDRERRAAAPARGRTQRGADAPAAGAARAARREAEFGRADARRPAAERPDRRPDWFPGGRTADAERGRGAERADRAPRTDREDRPFRGARADAPRRDDRPFRPSRPARDDRPRRDERDGRPERDAPARFDRAERTAPPAGGRYAGRDDRRDDRADRGKRAAPSFRDDRAAAPRRAERPFREDRAAPRRDDRPARFDRGTDRAPRPERRSDDRPRSSEAREPHRPSRAAQPARWEAPEDVVLERLQAEVVTADEVAGASFAGLGLGPRIVEALAGLGATQPFPIQSATVPDALAGRNVLGRGRTGSGKTIAFGAALVERLMRNWAESGRTGTGRRTGRPPRALILAPTRELALQIDRTVQPISRSVGLYTTQIVGGVPQARQVGALAKGVDIVIGTPGRIEDLLEQGRLDLSQIEIAVLDEADHMAELGFLEPMQRLLRRIPSRGQRMLFSATLDTAVAKLVDEFLPQPAVHEVAEPEGAVSADHRVLVIEQGAKLDVLTALIGSAERVLVFARTRAFAEQLTDDLDGAGVKAESLHGDLNQSRRTRNLQRFSEGRVAALVATDVAARGIHVDGIDLVVHADAAEDYKTYLHRSGRTGRAGASGTVVTLITARRRRRFTELLERAGIEAGFVALHPADDPVAALRS